MSGLALPRPSVLVSWPRDVVIVAGLALSELRHRRSLIVVTVITAGFLGLYGWGCFQILSDLTETVGDTGLRPIDTRRGAGFVLLGIAVFATFSLGSVLAVFTTMSTVKGEAEQGLLQPMLVRPLARSAIVSGRVLAATIAGTIYSTIVIVGSMLLTNAAGGEAPGNLFQVIFGLSGAIALVAAFGVLLSTFFGTAATGMAATMLVSVGFFASLVKQIGEATGSDTVADRANLITHILGFNALYEGSLGALTQGVGGLAGFAIALGPFGAQRSIDSGLVLLSALELVVLLAAATYRLRRLDL